MSSDDWGLPHKAWDEYSKMKAMPSRTWYVPDDEGENLKRIMRMLKKPGNKERIERGELVPVTGRHRVPRDGTGRIVVGPCGREQRVYHLSWSAMSCDCGETHEKGEFFVEVTNIYHDRECPVCGRTVEQSGKGRPRVVCEGACATSKNRVDTNLREHENRTGKPLRADYWRRRKTRIKKAQADARSRGSDYYGGAGHAA